jgi:rhamnogalacturonyl hydrolase YesR
MAFPSLAGESGVRRIGLKISQENPAGLPAGKRVPFGWPATGIAPGETILAKPVERLPDANLWIRVSTAQEGWDEKLLHVSIPGTKITLGAIDIRYSAVLVPYELEIPGEYANEINKYGLALTLESQSPLWIFSGSDSKTDHPAFLPHMVVSPGQTGTIGDLLDCFTSVSSVQSLGWREGCVLDGLWQLYSRKGNMKALETIRQHLDLFFDNNQNLIYETARSVPSDNRIDGIESTLPYATLAHVNPNHPVLKTVVAAWEEYTKPGGLVIDGKMISAEGCYTVAYPMAVIGKAWGDDSLKRKALEQLKHRFVLIADGQMNLRSTEGKYTFSNWARGAAWFLLGFARTASELKADIQDREVIGKFQEAVKIVLSMQRGDGLWGCFMNRPESLPDTSGSAGIAAAIMTGIHDGFLPAAYAEHAKRCFAGLKNYITPDGYLKGAAQDNRGGMKLQEGDYRVIAQMGAGLMAQLYASIEE